jgi:hypothetical protein
MKLARFLAATAVAGVIGVGGYAALPSAGAGQSSSPAPPAAAQLLSTSAAAPTTPPAACETDEWPDQGTGQPAGVHAGAPLGFFMWHNDAGWHLEVTHATHDHVVFSGWITTNGTLSAQRVDDEHNDIVRVGPHDHTLAFSFNNYGSIDGVHFETSCADRLVVHLFVEGRPATVEQIAVGHDSIHPLAVPFTISRSGMS